MNNTGIDIPEELLKNRANGYNYNYGSYTNAEYINMSSSIYAAGGIYSQLKIYCYGMKHFMGKICYQMRIKI